LFLREGGELFPQSWPVAQLFELIEGLRAASMIGNCCHFWLPSQSGRQL
jgi:hypothetical protein